MRWICLHWCRLASFAPSMVDAAEEEAAILAEAAESGEPVDMMQHLARTTLNVIGMTVFGYASFREPRRATSKTLVGQDELEDTRELKIRSVLLWGELPARQGREPLAVTRVSAVSCFITDCICVKMGGAGSLTLQQYI